MKSILITLLFASFASAAPVESRLEPLGQPVHAFNVLATRVVKDPAGKEWFVLSNTNETTGVELIFIDFAHNPAQTYRAPVGQGAWTPNQVPGDRLVAAPYYDGKMMVFALKQIRFPAVVPFPGEDYFWNATLGSDG